MSPELLNKLQSSVEKYKDSYFYVEKKLFLLLKSDWETSGTTVIFNEWDEIMASLNGGDCVELAKNLLFDWKKSGFLQGLTNLGYKTLYAEGQEPHFFNIDDDNHAFLLLQNQRERIIVDPALQVIENLDTSQYTVRDTKSVDDILRLPRGANRQLGLTKVNTIENFLNVWSDVSLETAIVGVTQSQSFAVFLGFLQMDSALVPIIRLSQKDQRYFLFIDPSNNTLISNIDTTNSSKLEREEIQKLIHVL